MGDSVLMRDLTEVPCPVGTLPDSYMYIHRLAEAGLTFQDGCVHNPQLLLQMTPNMVTGSRRTLVICGSGAQKFCIKMSVEVVLSLETLGEHPSLTLPICEVTSLQPPPPSSHGLSPPT